MHEAGVARRILEVALARAAAADATRITAVELVVGDPPDLDVGCLSLHWPLVTAGTAAEGAALRVLHASGPIASRLVAIDADALPDDGPGDRTGAAPAGPATRSTPPALSS